MTPPTLRLVPLAEEHIPELLRIENLSNTAPWSEQSFRNELGHAHGIFLVALVGGAPVGYGCLWLVIDEAHITTLAVDPEHRRQGIARRLLKDMLFEAKKRGAVCATLEVRAGNSAASSLYESLGFERRAVRPKYYPDNREDAAILWLDGLP